MSPMKPSTIHSRAAIGGKPVDFESGFTLVELLTVLAVISILMTMGMKALLIGGASLQNAGVEVSDAALMARNEAISRNSMSALVFKNSGNEAFRTYCVLTLKRPLDGTAPVSTDWIQGTPWKTLPVKVRFENSGNDNDVFKGTTGFYPPLPQTSYRGEAVAPSSLAAVIFSPNGQLKAAGVGDSAQLNLIPDLPGRTLATSTDWVRIDFNRATGNVRMTQP